MYNQNMNEYPKNLADFEKQFGTEEQCREYVSKLKWPNGYACPKCRYKKYWLTEGKEYKCQNCGHKTTVTTETSFHGSHLPLTLWFRAIWFLTSPMHNISVSELQKILELGSYHTAKKMYDSINDIKNNLYKKKLHGNVLVHETSIMLKYPFPIIFAIEWTESYLGRMRIGLSGPVSYYYLFIQKNIEKGSVIHTYGGKIRDELVQRGYSHVHLEWENDEIAYPLVCSHLLMLDKMIHNEILPKWRGKLVKEDATVSLDYIAEITKQINHNFSFSNGRMFDMVLRRMVEVALFNDFLDYAKKVIDSDDKFFSNNEALLKKLYFEET